MNALRRFTIVMLAMIPLTFVGANAMEKDIVDTAVSADGYHDKQNPDNATLQSRSLLFKASGDLGHTLKGIELILPTRRSIRVKAFPRPPRTNGNSRISVNLCQSFSLQRTNKIV